jgi:hypothetical protein
MKKNLPPPVTPSDEEPTAAGGRRNDGAEWNLRSADEEAFAAGREAIG